jgi:hypothetical protein
MNRRTFLLSSSTLPAVAAPPSTGAAVQAKEAPPFRRLLSSGYPEEKLAKLLLPGETWKPFPKAADRAGWSAVPDDARQKVLELGAKERNKSWPPLPATLALEFTRNGNRSHYEAASFGRRYALRNLVMAECLEGEGRYLDDIANGVWAICEETFWGVPAHIGAQRRGVGLPDVNEPIIDLFAAETAAQLAWIHYLLAPQLGKVSPLVPDRIGVEIERRMLEPFRRRNDFGWMGFTGHAVNNWNPWISSNVLTCALLMDRDPQRRIGEVHKALTCLDRFLDGYHDDGGCDEGPSYWGRAGASLFDCLELLRSASHGAIDFYSMPLVGEIGRYIYRAHIHDHWYTNFADAPARVHIAASLVFRYGRRIGDEKMQGLGAWAATQGSSGPTEEGSIGRELAALFGLPELRKVKAFQPLVRDVWLPGIQVMTARRKEGSAEGLYLAAQGGHNAESHNHNDVGNFIVYAEGQPAIIDIGVETYTAKTFSKDRYQIWTMQSAYHNLPTINGVMQAAGRQFAARDVHYQSNDAEVLFRMDLAAAYPAETGVASWTRTLRLDRARDEVTVRDAYRLKRDGGSVAFTLMTPCEVQETAPGVLNLAKIRVLFDARSLRLRVEKIDLTDAHLRGVWGDHIYRILFEAAHLAAAGEFLLRLQHV